MKGRTFLTHGVIIATGLLLGIIAQSIIRSDSEQILPVSQKSKTSRNTTSASRSSKSLSAVLKLINRDGRNEPKRTLEEEAILKSTLYKLGPGSYHEVAKAFAERNNPADEGLIMNLFMSWGHHAPHDALEAIKTMPPSLQESIESWTLQGWLTSDAKAALAYVNKEYPPLPPGERWGPLPHEDIWSSFANEDPEHALALASELLGSKKSRKIEDEIIRRMSFENPEKALKWVLAHREGEDLPERVKSLIYGWAATGKPQEILSQILTLPEELQTNELFQEFGTGLGRKLNRATQLLDEIPEVHRDHFLGGLIANAARYAPTQAVELSQHLPNGKIKQQAYHEIGEAWAGDDPVAAGEWLLTLPRSPSRDQAIRGFTWTLREKDPALAVAWASDIDKPHLKNGSVLHNSLLNWIERDATAARAWIDAQPEERLPAAIKKRVLKSFPE